MKTPTKKELVQKQKDADKVKKDAEKKAQAEISRLRAIASNQLVPLLQNKSESIEEAKMLTQALTIAIQQAFTNKQLEVKVSELGLDKMIDGKAEYDVMREALKMVENESVSDALKVLERFPAFVDMAIKKEMQTRKLSSLTLGLI